mgnify:CR=1 FL=1
MNTPNDSRQPPDDEMRRTYTACCASLDEVLKLLKAGRLG